MRPETEAWWQKAGDDLRSAQLLQSGEAWDSAVFYAHQAVEKALKALYIEQRRRMPPKTHNLVELARELSAPPEVVHACRQLNPEYIITRYPDAANGRPLLNYDAQIVADRISSAREVIRWGEEKL